MPHLQRFSGREGCNNRRGREVDPRGQAGPKIPDMARSVAGRPRADSAGLPKWIKPQLTKLVDEAPDGSDWPREIKFDGYRTKCRSSTSRVQTSAHRPVSAAVVALVRQRYPDFDEGSGTP
jgi:hypothetical protein